MGEEWFRNAPLEKPVAVTPGKPVSYRERGGGGGSTQISPSHKHRTQSEGCSAQCGNQASKPDTRTMSVTIIYLGSR